MYSIRPSDHARNIAPISAPVWVVDAGEIPYQTIVGPVCAVAAVLTADAAAVTALALALGARRSRTGHAAMPRPRTQRPKPVEVFFMSCFSAEGRRSTRHGTPRAEGFRNRVGAIRPEPGSSPPGGCRQRACRRDFPRSTRTRGVRCREGRGSGAEPPNPGDIARAGLASRHDLRPHHAGTHVTAPAYPMAVSGT